MRFVPGSALRNPAAGLSAHLPTSAWVTNAFSGMDALPLNTGGAMPSAETALVPPPGGHAGAFGARSRGGRDEFRPTRADNAWAPVRDLPAPGGDPPPLRRALHASADPWKGGCRFRAPGADGLRSKRTPVATPAP